MPRTSKKNPAKIYKKPAPKKGAGKNPQGAQPALPSAGEVLAPQHKMLWISRITQGTEDQYGDAADFLNIVACIDNHDNRPALRHREIDNAKMLMYGVKRTGDAWAPRTRMPNSPKKTASEIAEYRVVLLDKDKKQGKPPPSAPRSRHDLRMAHHDCA